VPSASARARAANQRIRAVVRADATDRLPFFCECGRHSCHSEVWLSLQEVAKSIENGRMILAHSR
jgi:hypothetical protein